MPVLRPEDIALILGLSEDELDTSGIKLTIGEIYRFMSEGSIGVSGRRLPEYNEVECVGGVYKLGAGAYLVRYGEKVRIPRDCIGIVLPRSTLLRIGATIETAVWDPGYEGRGVGLLLVFNENGVVLERKAHIAQLVLLKLTGEASKPYRGQYYGEG